MSAGTNTTSFPTRALTTGMRVARLPLTVVETVVRRRGSDWPPATAFTRLEATLFHVAAGVLHDRALEEEGERLEAAATKTQRATELDADAAQAKRRADSEREERLAAAERSQQEASDRAGEQRDRVAQRADQQRDAVAGDTKSRKAAARDRADATQTGLQRRRRSEQLAKARQESEALDAELTALDAQETVLELADEIEHSRQSRRG